MRDLVEYIVKSIVNNPDDVMVEMHESVDFPGLQIIKIKVNNEDLGIVIGKRGRTINAIRDLVKIAAIRNDKRVKVVIDEGDNPEKESEEKNDEIPDIDDDNIL